MNAIAEKCATEKYRETPEFNEAFEALAGRLYNTYCVAVGGKAFNGDPLPLWKDFSDDAKKAVQANGWRAVAVESIRALKT